MPTGSPKIERFRPEVDIVDSKLALLGQSRGDGEWGGREGDFM